MIDFNKERDVSSAINDFINWFYREDPEDSLVYFYKVIGTVVDECVKGTRDIKDARKIILREFNNKELADIVEDLIYAMKDSIDEGLNVFWAKVESDFH